MSGYTDDAIVAPRRPRRRASRSCRSRSPPDALLRKVREVLDAPDPWQVGR